MKFGWSFGATAAIALLAVLCILFSSTPNRAYADTGGAASPSAVHAVLLSNIDNGSNVGVQVAALHTVTLQTPACVANPVPAYVNPFSVQVAIGGAVQGYEAGWQNAVAGVEVSPTYKNFLGLPINLVGSARYFNYGSSDYWKAKCQWTIGAEAPLGGGATLFTRYENHFLVNDDWFFGGVRFTLQ